MSRKRDPRPCNREVYARGELIAVAYDMRAYPDAHAVERWVQRVAAAARARLDWYQSGGVYIMHLGDDASYRRAIAALTSHSSTSDVRVAHTFSRGRISPLRRDRTSL